MMGVWFLGASVGNYLGGQLAGFYETLPLSTSVRRRGLLRRSRAGVLMFAFYRTARRLMGGADR